MAEPMLVAPLLAFAAIGLAVVGAGEMAAARRLQVAGQLQKLAAAPLLPVADRAAVRGAAGRSRFPWLERVASVKGHGERLRRELAQAGLHLRVGEYQAIRLAAAVMGFGLGALLSRHWALALAFGGLGLLVPGLVVGMRRKRHTKQFNAQLVECLELMSTSIRSGFSFLQSLESAQKELLPPMSVELGKTLREISLGVSTEEALVGLVDRTEDADLRLAITAVLVQRRVGGNLSEVLDNISHTLRERIRIRGEIQTLTSQARLSGLMVGFLPLGLAGMLTLLNPGYLTPLLTHPVGKLMTAGAVVAEAVGFFIIQKMVHVDY